MKKYIIAAMFFAFFSLAAIAQDKEPEHNDKEHEQAENDRDHEHWENAHGSGTPSDSDKGRSPGGDSKSSGNDQDGGVVQE